MGPDERGMPPAMLERVRGAALRCLAATAADAGARPVMATLAWDIAEALAPLLGNAHAASLRDAAAKVFRDITLQPPCPDVAQSYCTRSQRRKRV